MGMRGSPGVEGLRGVRCPLVFLSASTRFITVRRSPETVPESNTGSLTSGSSPVKQNAGVEAVDSVVPGQFWPVACPYRKPRRPVMTTTYDK